MERYIVYCELRTCVCPGWYVSGITLGKTYVLEVICGENSSHGDKRGLKDDKSINY